MSGLRWEQVEPLYDELLAQVDRVPDPDKPEAVIRLSAANVDAHAESAATLFKLRAEALGICLNFTLDGKGWTFLQTLIPARQG